jgi:hypothetical protein
LRKPWLSRIAHPEYARLSHEEYATLDGPERAEYKEWLRARGYVTVIEYLPEPSTQNKWASGQKAIAKHFGIS